MALCLRVQFFWPTLYIASFLCKTKCTLSWNKEAYKKFCKFSIYRYIYWKFPMYIYPTKYTLSWNKKHQQNMSEIFDMVHMSLVRSLVEV